MVKSKQVRKPAKKSVRKPAKKPAKKPRKSRKNFLTSSFLKDNFNKIFKRKGAKKPRKS